MYFTYKEIMYKKMECRTDLEFTSNAIIKNMLIVLQNECKNIFHQNATKK